MKRLWFNRVDVRCNSKKYIIDGNNEGPDNCAICRNRLDKLCTTCEVDKSDETKHAKHTQTQFSKYIWTFLLTEQRREDSPFNKFDTNVISKLYQYCTSGIGQLSNCLIVVLECKHRYHRHCFQKWTYRRRSCPLCNSSIIMPIAVYGGNEECHGSLTRVFESKHSPKHIHERDDDKLYARAVVVRLLKHHKPGYDYDSLYSLACEKYIRSIDKDIFKYIIRKLIRKGYIELKNNKYVYIP